MPTPNRDLFGKPIRHRRPKYEWSLERMERASLPVRAERVRWLDRVIPRRSSYLMPMQTFYVFEEAKSAFVYGCFAASTVLAAAFVEHWLGAQLTNRGFGKQVEQGLAAMTELCRTHGFLAPAVADRVDRLRAIRNPFVHLKKFEHKHSLGQRAYLQRTHPEDLLESDAKESLITMYTVSAYSFKDS